MNDTPPHVVELYRALLMGRSGEERLAMGARMFDAARAIVIASLPPELPPDEMRRQLFARLYPDIAPDRVPPELRPRWPAANALPPEGRKLDRWVTSLAW